jgi:hypothetical protein
MLIPTSHLRDVALHPSLDEAQLLLKLGYYGDTYTYWLRRVDFSLCDVTPLLQVQQKATGLDCLQRVNPCRETLDPPPLPHGGGAKSANGSLPELRAQGSRKQWLIITARYHC